MVPVSFETGHRPKIPSSPLEGEAAALKQQFQAGIDGFLRNNSVRLNGYKVGEMSIEGGVSESFLERLRVYGFRPLAAGPVTVNYSLVPHQGELIYAISIGDQNRHKIGLILQGDKPTVRETEEGDPLRFTEVTNDRLSTPQQRLEFGLFLVEMVKA